MKWLSFLSVIFAWSSFSSAVCVVLDNMQRPAGPRGDALAWALEHSPSCPLDSRQLKSSLQSQGLQFLVSMVANRGRHNPKLGSFSFFESAQGQLKGGPSVAAGQFFFGHFLGAENGQVILDQAPDEGKLMIELIAWDPQKGLYNFYELIGQKAPRLPQWFYRGDTADILADNQQVHLTAGPPSFGNRLRCSGCHSSGGPIMKELDAPHNDWWSSLRPLPFAPNKASAEVQTWMQGLRDGIDSDVKAGIMGLEASPRYRSLKASRSLRQELRPLFCENEVNLASAPETLENGAVVHIPSGFFVHSILGSASIQMSKGSYQQMLSQFRMKFPETNRSDADQSWLTPVRSVSDDLAVKTLITRGLITQEFAADVLAIDPLHPVFSKARCDLLKIVPDQATGRWMEELTTRLQMTRSPAAQELFANLTQASRDLKFHRTAVQSLLLKAQQEIGTPAGAAFWFRQLLERRTQLAASPISKNPRGQILEPGFRVIFPVPGAP